MKRGHSDVLTGGSKDVNPQILTLTANQSAIDTDTDINVFLPVQRLNAKSGRSLVMEILRVKWFLLGMPTVAGAAVARFQALLTTNMQAPTAPNTAARDPRNISIYNMFWQVGAASNAGFQFNQEAFTKDDDLTDGAGHGVLVATDNMNINLQSANTGIVNNMAVQILYRWKEITLVEYIGIVQSQQT